jgi:hypothetical protein
VLVCFCETVFLKFLDGSTLCAVVHCYKFLYLYGNSNKYKSFRNMAKTKLTSEFDNSNVKKIFIGIAALSQMILSFILLKISG